MEIFDDYYQTIEEELVERSCFNCDKPISDDNEFCSPECEKAFQEIEN